MGEKQKTENAKIQEVSLLIKQGANTFMRREYLVLAKFAAVAAIVILILLPSPIWTGSPVDNISMAIAYLCGTALSAIAGKIGILVATLSNGRTAEAAQKGIKPAFLIGFRGGAVMGLLVVGCSLLGVAAVLMITGDSSILLGFSFWRQLPGPVRQGRRRHLYQDRRRLRRPDRQSGAGHPRGRPPQPRRHR